MPLGPKRREIGHGNLAKRAIKAVLPDVEDFGYTMRVVSEITESNGSSSIQKLQVKLFLFSLLIFSACT